MPARDHDLAPRGERGQGEVDRGRVVVHREPRLRTRDQGEKLPHREETRAPLAGREIHFEVRVAGCGRVKRGLRFGRERRAAEVRVQQHAGRVDHAAKHLLAILRAPRIHAREEKARPLLAPASGRLRVLGHRAQRRARFLDHLTQPGEKKLARHGMRGLPLRERARQERIDRGQ